LSALFNFEFSLSIWSWSSCTISLFFFLSPISALIRSCWSLVFCSSSCYTCLSTESIDDGLRSFINRDIAECGLSASRVCLVPVGISRLIKGFVIFETNVVLTELPIDPKWFYNVPVILLFLGLKMGFAADFLVVFG
jgi:hypothetical protein